MTKRTTRRSAGFTLVELMIALVIGGLVISSMYMVGAASSRHFQIQHQSANMQSALRFAMIQLKRDLSRAGFHATARDTRDPLTCPPTNMSSNIELGGDGWIAGISSFRNDTSLANVVDVTGNNAANGFVNDELTIVGNIATSNEYAGIQMVGTNMLLLDIAPTGIWHSLQADFGWNPITGVATTTINPALVAQVFPRDGLIRIQMTNGRRHFATLVSPGTVTGTDIQLSFSPGIMPACIADANDGWVAPLQVIRYDAAASAANGMDSDRVTGSVAQLIRTQRLPTNKDQIFPGSVPRVVLDYLAAFDVWFTTTADRGPMQPDLYNIGQTINAQQAINNNPELVRALTVTLAVRAASTDPGMRFINCGGLRCFQLHGETGAGAPAARVRSLRTEIFLPNIAAEGF